ncbi:unnamed protein product [Rotaria socialis]|uniref:Uncharacterized protein n=1 Tax=Rotaria socialis TaxID=392032 RepID=A0A817R6U9_9BILA|nr:unnamed protein product [Rotaria socialis]CAF3368318.1 unnamed protein product [Rotaria socialis]CAF3411598.1 unnamed protein product [Rotaria socialis]CAF3490502.1 unnamed protein product [Rotaria socialis]CAF3665630.1 unnamed protein product [Rotaria socialis]
MAASRGYAANGVRIGMNFDYLDDMQLQNHRFSSIALRPYHQEYEHQETRNDDKHQTSKSEHPSFCSKQCMIGLAIGLIIGVLLVVAVVVPVALLKTCPLGAISSTPNWIGTFLMDGECDTTRCCCLSNQVKFFQTTNNQLQMTGSATGMCTGSPTTIFLTIPMPTSFQILTT